MAKAIADHIKSVLEPHTTNSELYIYISNNDKSRSIYVNVCYKDRHKNPLDKKMPYVVRISDHNGSPLFHKNEPDATIVIHTTIPDDEQNHYNKLVKDYKKYSEQLIGCHEHEAEETLRLMNKLNNDIETIKKRALFHTNADVDATCAKMIEIIKANKHNHVA